MIRYLPVAWCPISGVWWALDLWRWRFVDLDARGRLKC